MTANEASYGSRLVAAFGDGWTRFWFAPTDPLPLGLIRVLTGLAAIYFVATYTPDLERLFGPQGLLPTEAVEQLASMKEFTLSDEGSALPYYRFSYFDRLQTRDELLFAHYGGLAVLGLFTLGVFTRLTSWLALVVVLSYIHRLPLVTSQAEPILTLLLLYLALGPSGAALSCDRCLAQRLFSRSGKPAAAGLPWWSWFVAGQPGPSWGANVALRLMQVHLSVIHGVMALLLLYGESWWDGNGIWFLLARPDSRLLDLTWLHDYPLFVALWTHGTVAYLLLQPVLVWNRLARPLVLAWGALVWLGLLAASAMGLFCSLMLIGSLAYLSADALRALRPAARQVRLSTGG